MPTTEEKFENFKMEVKDYYSYNDNDVDTIKIEDNCSKELSIYLEIQGSDFENSGYTALNKKDAKLFINKFIESYEILFEEKIL